MPTAHATPSTMRWSRSSSTCARPFVASGNVLASDWRRTAALTILALVLAPSVAHAWTPGTHVFLGEAVLGALGLLPASLAELLRAFPYDFLYGSIAADTSIAKKYAPA